jgi:hypothetical protein
MANIVNLLDRAGGNRFVSFQVKGLDDVQRKFGLAGQAAFDRAARQMVTFTARDYDKSKYKTIRKDIDRPAPFTRFPKVYDFDGAPETGPIVARAYVNTRQSHYLLLDEVGGSRQKEPGKGQPFAPNKKITDRYGGLYGNKGLQKKFLTNGPHKTGGRPASSFTDSGRPIYAPGSKRYFVATLNIAGRGPVEGLFVRTKLGKQTTKGRKAAGVKQPGWRTTLLVEFEDRAKYKARLGFRRDAAVFGTARMGKTFTRLLARNLKELRASIADG